MTGTLRVASWNVNGLRACASRGFADWLAASRAAIVGLQEVRAHEGQLPKDLRAIDGWHSHFSSARKPGYSGVALYSRRPFTSVETTLGEPRFDSEGRVQLARFGKLLVANVYFPNGSGKERDNSRVPFKLAFYRALFDRLARARRAGRRVLVIGDFNTAHQEIDLARPQANANTSGFLPEEREELDRWIAAGYCDTFRRFEKRPGHYSWWSQRQGSRERNVGWRLDYVLACARATPFVRAAGIEARVIGSDHCPVWAECDPAIV